MVYGLILLVGIHSMLNDSGGTVKVFGNLKKVESSQRAVVAQYDSGNAKLEVFKTGIVHLSIVHGNNERKSFAVIESPEELSQYKITADTNKISVDLDDGIVSYSPETMKVLYSPKNGSNGLDMTGIQFSDSGFAATIDIHGTRNFYGLGEKTLPFNKYGSRCTMWNSDFPAYNVKFDPLYESIPFLLKADTSGAYGLFFDNTFRSTFDIGASDSDKFVYTSAGGAFELYIITGKNAAEVVQRFSELTGKMPMPPVWSLGYQQSRWSYYPEQKVLDLAHGFRDRKIPCDVIYLDINYMDGYKCFTWSPKDFPTPKNMLDTLHDMGFKVVTIIDPGIKDEKGYGVYDSGLKQGVFVKEPNGKYFVGQVWPGDCVFPDFLNEKTRAWWGEQYKALIDSGVDGFWNDMNEPSVFNSPNKTFPLGVIHRLDDGTQPQADEPLAQATHAEVHNVYGMQMARATREGLEKLEPDKRPLVLTRANYAGGQRYAAMWTGDNFASFAHMKLALTMFLNLGVSGQPFVGSDVGGFIGNPSAELFSRWLELGVFSPFFRTHSVIDSKPREPWAFDSASTKINREIIDRRYELLPEIYTAFRNANQDGLPIVKPLYLNFPNDKEVYDISDEFLFGDNLLVAPVFDSGAVSRKVYLPEGNWEYLYDGTKIQKGRHEVDTPLGKTPVFVRDGTILFTQSVIQSTSKQVIDPPKGQAVRGADTLLLKVYGDKSAKGKVYFDDGETMAYKSGDSLVWNVSYAENSPKGQAGRVDTTGSRYGLTFNRTGDFEPQYKFLAIDIPVPFEGMAQEPPPHAKASAGGIHAAVMKTSDGEVSIGGISKAENGSTRVTFPFSSRVESIDIQ